MPAGRDVKFVASRRSAAGARPAAAPVRDPPDARRGACGCVDAMERPVADSVERAVEGDEADDVANGGRRPDVGRAPLANRPSREMRRIDSVEARCAIRRVSQIDLAVVGGHPVRIAPQVADSRQRRGCLVDLVEGRAVAGDEELASPGDNGLDGVALADAPDARRGAGGGVDGEEMLAVREVGDAIERRAVERHGLHAVYPDAGAERAHAHRVPRERDDRSGRRGGRGSRRRRPGRGWVRVRGLKRRRS